MTQNTPYKSKTAAGSPDPASIEGLFLAALAKPSAEEREAFLDDTCGADFERRQRVVALLRAYDDAGSFLERPVSGVVITQSLDLSFLEPSENPDLLGTLAHYEVYELIGRGGMGMVFRVRDPKLNRIVAIKVLAPEFAANANARNRFLREAQAAAAISHPNVVTIYAVEDRDEQAKRALPFIAMQCVVGQTLQQKLIAEGSLPLAEIVRIGQQMAEGLAAAHKQGLVHRDIKPANILLENGVERVRITDFGLARAVDDATITRTGEVTGTPQYMSPEQASGERIDHRSDLFSLGCVLYAMCTGRSPFRATNIAGAIKRVCQDTPREIDQINSDIPEWLRGLISQLLQKDPEQRPASARDIAAFLQQHLASLNGSNSEPPPVCLGTVLSATEDRNQPELNQTAGRAPSLIRQPAFWLAIILLLFPLAIRQLNPSIPPFLTMPFGCLALAFAVARSRRTPEKRRFWSRLWFGSLCRFVVNDWETLRQSPEHQQLSQSLLHSTVEPKYPTTMVEFGNAVILVTAAAVLTRCFMAFSATDGGADAIAFVLTNGPLAICLSLLGGLCVRCLVCPGESTRSIGQWCLMTVTLLVSAYIPFQMGSVLGSPVLTGLVPLLWLALVAFVAAIVRAAIQVRPDASRLRAESYGSVADQFQVLSVVLALAVTLAYSCLPKDYVSFGMQRQLPAYWLCVVGGAMAVGFFLIAVLLRRQDRETVLPMETLEAVAGRGLTQIGMLLLSVSPVGALCFFVIGELESARLSGGEHYAWAYTLGGCLTLALGLAIRKVKDREKHLQRPLRLWRVPVILLLFASIAGALIFVSQETLRWGVNAL